MTDLFDRQKQCLRVMGHHFVRDKSLLLRSWRNIVYFGVLLLVISAQWPTMSYTICYIDNLDLATASLSICFTNILGVTKIATFLSYKWRFVALMTKLEAMYNESKDLDAQKILKDANRKAVFAVKVYWMFTSSTGVYFMLAPILKICWLKIRQEDAVLELPMPMRFEFDFESFPGYGFAYVYTGAITVTVVMYSVAIDGLFVTFAINLVSHLKMLQKFIVENSFLKSDEDCHGCLKNFIAYHNLILSLYNELREIYSPIIFGQFLMTSLQVCVILYQMLKNLDSVLVLIVNCTFLSTILLQLFIYCYGGEMLKVESLMVGVSVQLSHWYNLKPAHRRMLLLLMVRSQREAIIKAGIYVASYAKFLAILQAAFSYITLIQSIE